MQAEHCLQSEGGGLSDVMKRSICYLDCDWLMVTQTHTTVKTCETITLKSKFIVCKIYLNKSDLKNKTKGVKVEKDLKSKLGDSISTEVTNIYFGTTDL